MAAILKSAAVAVIFLSLACARPAHAKDYRFLMPVVEGISMKAVPQMLRDAASVLEKKTGVKVEMKDYNYKKGSDIAPVFIKMFKKGELDFGMFFSRDYVKYKLYNGKLVKPLFTLEIFGKPYSTVCMYTLKSAGYKEVKDLKDKRWGGSYTIPTRFMLYKAKHKKTLDKFFKKMVYVDDTNPGNLVDALIADKIDVFFLPMFQIEMLKNSDAKYKKIEATNCTKYEHNWIFVYHKSVPKKDVKKFQKTFLNAHRDKDFAQFKFLMTAIKGKFVKYSSKYMKTTKTLAKLCKKYKWEEEERDFIKKNAK